MTTKRTTKKPEPEKEDVEKKPTEQQFQQSAAQAIQSYFTKDINDKVNEMTNDVMYARLRQLETSDYWTAILRYNNLKLLNSQSALNSMDPVQNPTAISRQQGAMMGLVDLQNSIIIMVEAEKAAQREMSEIEETF